MSFAMETLSLSDSMCKLSETEEILESGHVNPIQTLIYAGLFAKMYYRTCTQNSCAPCSAIKQGRKVQKEV